MPWMVAGAVGVGLLVGLILKATSTTSETIDAASTSAAPVMSSAATAPPVTTSAPSSASAEPEPSASAAEDLGDTRTLILDIMPNNAFVMFAEDGVPEGKKYAGPWPRHLDIPPGKYQLVVFLHGFKTVQTGITIEKGKEAQALRLQLQPDDIYE